MFPEVEEAESRGTWEKERRTPEASASSDIVRFVTSFVSFLDDLQWEQGCEALLREKALRNPQ